MTAWQEIIQAISEKEFEQNRLLRFQSQIVITLHDACESGDLTAAKQLLSQISDPEKAMGFRIDQISKLEREIDRLQAIEARFVELCRQSNSPCFCGAHIATTD